jgi:hypothetical protein
MRFDNFSAVDIGYSNFINVPQSVGYVVKATDIYDFKPNIWIINIHRNYQGGNTSPINPPSQSQLERGKALYVAPNTNGANAKLVIRLEKNPSVPYNRTYELQAIWRFKNFRQNVNNYLNALGNSSLYDMTMPFVTPLQAIQGVSMQPYVTGCSEANRFINEAWYLFNTQFQAKGYRLAVLIMGYDIVTPNAPIGYSKIYTDSYSIPMDSGRQRRLYVQFQTSNSPYPEAPIGSMILPRLAMSRNLVKDYLATTYPFLEANGLILPSSEATNLFLSNLYQLQIQNGIRVVTNATNT